jgi:hypothetical protein
MALTEWELWACANELVKQHGREAIVKASLRRIELHDQGDEAGAEAWHMIELRVIKLLQKPAAASTRH